LANYSCVDRCFYNHFIPPEVSVQKEVGFVGVFFVVVFFFLRQEKGKAERRGKRRKRKEKTTIITAG